MKETLFTEQEQGKATDLKSIDRHRDEHRGRVLAAVRGYLKGDGRSVCAGRERDTGPLKTSKPPTGIDVQKSYIKTPYFLELESNG